MGSGGGKRIGGDSVAHGAQQSAQAEKAFAQHTYDKYQLRVNSATQDLNKITVGGLAQFDADIARQEKNLSRQEQMLQAIDPTVMEASQQALRLLRGETSSTLAPLQRQRDMQRQKLISSLREQLGPGAETSTAGIQALTRFDSESGSMFASAQQQALGNLGTISGQFSAQRPDMFREIAGMSQLNQGKMGLGFQKAGFDMARAQNLYEARNAMAGMQGARFVGSTMRGLEQQKAGFMMANLGGSMLGGMGGGGGGGGNKEQVDYGGAGGMAGGSYNDYSGTA